MYSNHPYRIVRLVLADHLMYIPFSVRSMERKQKAGIEAPTWMEMKSQTHQMSVDEFHLNKILIGRQTKSRHPF